MRAAGREAALPVHLHNRLQYANSRFRQHVRGVRVGLTKPGQDSTPAGATGVSADLCWFFAAQNHELITAG